MFWPKEQGWTDADPFQNVPNVLDAAVDTGGVGEDAEASTSQASSYGIQAREAIKSYEHKGVQYSALWASSRDEHKTYEAEETKPSWIGHKAMAAGGQTRYQRG